MSDNELKLSDLHFDKLNENDCGVTFRVLDRADSEKLMIPYQEWSCKVCGLECKATIRAWHMIELAQKDVARVVLLGVNADTGESWCTSFVAAVAPDFSAVHTNSGSLYRLEGQATGKPNIQLVLYLVYTLRYWGLGRIVQSWPSVFY